MADKLNSFGKLDQLERRVHRLTVDSVTKLIKKEGLIDSVLENDPKITEVLSGPVAVVSIDFDKFKEVNDNFGHEKGDVYLRDISSEIDRYSWEDGDDTGFAFRGKEGDEIVVVLAVGENSMQAYKSRVSRFRASLNQSLFELGKEFPSKGINRDNPSLSLGSVFEPELFVDASLPEKLMLLLDLVDKKADIAVYNSKSRKDVRTKETLADLTYYEDLNV